MIHAQESAARGWAGRQELWQRAGDSTEPMGEDS